MPKTSDAHDGKCPQCGHVFTLAELKRMAMGDGFQRYIPVLLASGEPKYVAFDDFRPGSMQAYPGPQKTPFTFFSWPPGAPEGAA